MKRLDKKIRSLFKRHRKDGLRLSVVVVLLVVLFSSLGIDTPRAHAGFWDAVFSAVSRAVTPPPPPAPAGPAPVVTPYWQSQYGCNGSSVAGGCFPSAVDSCAAYSPGSAYHDPNSSCYWNPITAVIGLTPLAGGGGTYRSFAMKGNLAGSGILSVPQGATVQLDWSCQPRQVVNYYNWQAVEWTVRTNSFSSASSGSGFSTGGFLSGSIQITPPGGPGTVTTYTLTCNAATNPNNGGGFAYSAQSPASVSIQAQIAQPVLSAPPTVTITGNGAGAVTVLPGQAVNIVATFTPGAGDTLLRTAINDSSSNLLPGVSWTPPTNKSHTFVTNTPGTYTFYPGVQTNAYPSWNNYNKSLVVTVAPSCTPGPGGGGCTPPVACTGPHQYGIQPNCGCVSGYVMQGGSCVLGSPVTPGGACTGAHQLGVQPNCTCEVGYVMQSGSCVAATCPGAHEVNYPTCSCATGYTRTSGQCITTPVVNIRVNGVDAVRVRKGNTVTLTWNTSGVNSCQVRDNTGALISTAANSPTPSPTRVIDAATTFTLRCNNELGSPVTAAANVTLIPSFQEQ